MERQVRAGDPIPCMGWCVRKTEQVEMFRRVGNDIEKAREAKKVCLDQGIKCECHHCSTHLLRISEAFDHHIALLDCRKKKDEPGALAAARSRGCILKDLGYTCI